MISRGTDGNITTDDKGSGFIDERPANRSMPTEHTEGSNSSSTILAAHLPGHKDDEMPPSSSAPNEQVNASGGNNTIPREPAVHLQEHEELDGIPSKEHEENVTDRFNGDSLLAQAATNESVPLIQEAHLAGVEELSRRSPVGLDEIPESGVADDHQRNDPHLVALRDEDHEESTAARLVEEERENQRTRRTTEDEDSSSIDWVRDNRWMTSASVCDWYGIHCEKSGGHDVIKQLNLTANNLKGTLPSELQTLTHLEVLDVSKNHILGQIPLVIWMKLHLHTLVVSENLLSGTIPTQVDILKAARKVDLSFNALHGTIPPVVAKMSALGVLNLEGNVLEGTIPSLAELTDLSRSLRRSQFPFVYYQPSSAFCFYLSRRYIEVGQQHPNW